MTETDPAPAARRLMRRLDRATLATATSDAPPGWPMPTLVLVALTPDATPRLLISTLADHTRTLTADPRAGLLFDGTHGLASPLTGPRLSVLGRAERDDGPDSRRRYLARHPDAALYAGFGDFALYRVTIDRALLVAGFGRIHRLAGSALRAEAADLAEAEPALLASLPPDAGDRLASDGTGWTVTGIDPDGCDLRRGGEVGRVNFPAPVEDAAAAAKALVALLETRYSI